MNRKYSTSEFLTLVNKIYKLNPYTSISTDYIVGFPTETENNHYESIEFLKLVKFSKIHVFPYSIRSYTPASKLPQIKDYIKSNRVKEILELNKELSKEFINKFVNKNVDVIFEKQINNNTYIGHTSEYFEVIVKSDENILNKLCLVKINRIIGDNTIGELIKILD